MLQSFEGIYRDGKVELLEVPENSDGSRVIVTFVHASEEKISNLSREQLADLRWRLSTFEDDWNAPGMEVYDAL